MDAFQHINNTVYFRYFKDVRIAYFEQSDMLEFKQKLNTGPIMATAKSNFRVPLLYPDSINIGCRVVDVERRKFTMQYAVYSHRQQSIVADGDGLMVYFNYTENKSCDIPEKLVTAIGKLENSNLDIRK